VVDVGRGVSKVKKNDRVVLTWIKSGGMNVAGPKYVSGEQVINAGPVTTFSTLTIVSENRCVLLPPDIAPAVASLLGCAIPTGLGMVMNSIKPAKNSGIAIFGLGGIGLSALLGAVASECKPVVAVDINPEKLAMAERFGATHMINARDQDPVDAIRSLTGGEGISYAVEASGTTKTIEQAFQSVKMNGGLCVFASHPPYGQKISIDPFDMICGRQLRGSWGGDSMPDRDIPRWADLYLRKKLPFDKLITHRLPFRKINEAVTLLKNGQAGRVLLEMN
jgi:S-(hydroxymethyl)glutathione dehydrogenase/alcohol dehydrogenase